MIFKLLYIYEAMGKMNIQYKNSCNKQCQIDTVSIREKQQSLVKVFLLIVVQWRLQWGIREAAASIISHSLKHIQINTSSL